MTVLVTGAGGFLGRRLVEMLAERSARVRAMVRPGRPPASFPARGVEVVAADLADPPSLAAATAGAATVVHCAALSSDWGRWRAFEAANLTGTRNLLAAAVAAGVRRFVHVSTTDVYGYPAEPCGEDHRLRDVGLPYNSSKVGAERAVWACHRATGLPVVVIRPASIYGPRNKDLTVEAARLIRSGRLPLLEGGRSGAGLIYVDDAVEVLIAAADAPGAVGRAYNLRHPDDVTWRAYFEALARAIERPSRFSSIPRAVAWPAAVACEALHGALRRPGRPLLTRHAVALMTRDQNFPVARVRRDLAPAFGFDLAAGMARIGAGWTADGGR